MPTHAGVSGGGVGAGGGAGAGHLTTFSHCG